MNRIELYQGTPLSEVHSRNAMNGPVLITVLALGVAFTAPAFAVEAGHQPLTKADCKKAA
jgi:hypothetical protein